LSRHNRHWHAQSASTIESASIPNKERLPDSGKTVTVLSGGGGVGENVLRAGRNEMKEKAFKTRRAMARTVLCLFHESASRIGAVHTQRA